MNINDGEKLTENTFHAHEIVMLYREIILGRSDFRKLVKGYISIHLDKVIISKTIYIDRGIENFLQLQEL